jgi:prepilin-type N-terminal cleavage/methylation domain-containing protein
MVLMDTARPARSQDGFTLVEMMVALLVMAIFMVGVLTDLAHVIMPTQTTNNLAATQSQLNEAFLSLDHEVRYASAIDTPGAGTVTTNFYVELQSNYSGTASCTQLKYDKSAGILYERSWQETSPLPATPNWTVLARSLQTSPSSPPFAFKPVNGLADSSGAVYAKQRLLINLTALAGSGVTKEQSTTNMAFTAIDSEEQGDANTDNGSLICQDFGRP